MYRLGAAIAPALVGCNGVLGRWPASETERLWNPETGNGDELDGGVVRGCACATEETPPATADAKKPLGDSRDIDDEEVLANVSERPMRDLESHSHLAALAEPLVHQDERRDDGVVRQADDHDDSVDDPIEAPHSSSA